MGSLFFGYWPTLFPFSRTHSHTWHLIPDWWLMTPEVFQRGPPRVKITCHKYRSSKIPFSRHSPICTCCSIVCVCLCVYTCACAHRCAKARNLDLWLWKHLKMCAHLSTSKHPLPLLFLSRHFSACVARVKKGRGITPTTPSKMQNNSCYSLLKLFLNFFVHSLLFFSPGLPFPQSNRRKNYPSCPLISIESFFPGWKHCHPFSLHSLPFPLFISVKWLPQGETELGNNMRQVSQEESSHKKKKNFSSSTRSIHPPIHSSRFSTLLCPPITPPTLSTLMPTKGRAPSPSQRNFLVEIHINFRGFKFYPQCVKLLNLQ